MFDRLPPAGFRASVLARSWALLFLCALAILVACQHRRYDPATGVVSRKDVTYRTGGPGAGWRLLSGGDDDVAFFNKSLLATISTNAVCNMAGDPPLRVLLNHLLIGFTEKHVKEEQTVNLDGRDTLRARFSAKLDGVPREFVVYILKKDGCVFDLQYHAPAQSFEQGIGPFEAYVKAFGTVK